MLLLAGDAARDRGVLMRARLEQLDRDNPVPVLVITPPELGGMATQPLPRHVGYLAPSGGVSECAKRVQALLELFAEEGLASCSLQQLADTVSSRVKAAQAEGAKPAAAGGRAAGAPKPTTEPVVTATRSQTAEREPTSGLGAVSSSSSKEHPAAASSAATDSRKDAESTAPGSSETAAASSSNAKPTTAEKDQTAAASSSNTKPTTAAKDETAAVGGANLEPTASAADLAYLWPVSMSRTASQSPVT